MNKTKPCSQAYKNVISTSQKNIFYIIRQILIDKQTIRDFRNMLLPKKNNFSKIRVVAPGKRNRADKITNLETEQADSVALKWISRFIFSPSLAPSLSLYLYIYIYIYTDRERAREYIYIYS